MKIIKYDNEQEWLASRDGKITGSKSSKILSKSGAKKDGYWELLSEILTTSTTGIDNQMERGHILEKEAITKYSKQVGIDFITDLVKWEREDYKNIAISPDGYTKDLKQASEVKCLKGSKHIKAIAEDKPPKKHHDQVVQYFVVNDNLEKLHFIMYNPDFEELLQLKVFIFTREELKTEIEEKIEVEKQILEELNNTINKLTF